MDFLTIQINERELKTTYKMGEEIIFEDHINFKIYKGIIYAICHNPCEPKLELIIRVNEARDLIGETLKASEKVLEKVLENKND